jgi:outer membrane immunogenic protein
MRSKLLCAIALLGSTAAGAGLAVAADIPVRGAPPAASPAVVAVPDWVGFYFGGHGGGGSAHESFENSVSECDNGTSQVNCTPNVFFLPPGVNASGGLGGIQFGHNWQWGQVVGGLEVDFSWADLSGSSAFSVPFFSDTQTFTTDKKIDELASVRGRLGYLIIPSVLLYGTAGIGFGHERITTTVSERETQTGTLEFEENAMNHVNMFGWVAGAGVEWKFWNNWLLRGEWLHYDFGKVTNSTNNPGIFFAGLDNGNLRTTVDIGRAALSYKFPP